MAATPPGCPATMRHHYATEKREGIERWVFLNIAKVHLTAEGRSDYQHQESLFHYDLPREVYERRPWVPRWRVARLQCLYPRHDIRLSFSYYDKKTRLSLMDGPLTERTAVRRQITRITNRLTQAKRVYLPTLYNPTIDSTDAWVKANEKLARYQRRLQELDMAIEQLQNDPANLARF